MSKTPPTEFPQALIPQMLFEQAWEFHRAYLALPVTLPPSWPRYFMLCHSIELALKAFLAARGTKIDDVVGFGHKLKELVDEAVKSRLTLNSCTLENLKVLDEAHTNYWARYPKWDGKPVFIIEQFEPDASALLEAVRKAVFPT